MPRAPKPWYRKDRESWFVTIAGCRHNLGPDKKEAFKQFYALMQAPEPSKVSKRGFAAIADAFLDWVKANRSPHTFEWYRYRGPTWEKSHHVGAEASKSLMFVYSC